MDIGFVSCLVKFGPTELSFFFWQNPCRQIYNLGMVSGPVLLKIKGKVAFSYVVGQTTKTKSGNIERNEIGQMLVPGALNDTKKIRKAGADIFANFGAEKPWIYPKTGRMQPRRPTLHGALLRASLVKSLTPR